MRLKLIRSVRLSAPQNDLAMEERSLVCPHPTRLSRRALFRGGAGALGALLMPVAAVQMAGCDPLALIIAKVIELAVNNANTIEDILEGVITLVNTDTVSRDGDVWLRLLDSEAIKHKDVGAALDEGRPKYSIPPDTMNTYQWGGLQADKAGDYVVRATTALSDVDSDLFTLAQ